MAKELFPVKACPWCGKTGSFYMLTPQDKTWLARIKCKNYACPVQPEGKYVPIRKSQRGKKEVLREKVVRCLEKWNSGNLLYNNEGFGLDFEKIETEFLLGKVGESRDPSEFDGF